MKVDIKTINKTVITVTMHLLEDLFFFLHEQGALINFVTAVTINNGPQRFITLAQRRDPESWISGAFVWYATPQNSNYWEDINAKWHAHLDSVKEKVRKNVAQEGTEVEVILKPEGDEWI